MPVSSDSELIETYTNRAKAHAMPPHGVCFDPLTMLVLAAILSAVISHIVQKCLNQIDPVSLRKPGFFQRRKLKKLIRERCNDSSVWNAAREAGIAPLNLDETFGAAAYEALLKTAGGLTDTEAKRIVGGK